MSLHNAHAAITSRWPEAKPRHAMVCGSGWGGVGESFSVLGTIPYGEIPILGASTVEGHAGQLLLAEVAGTEILIFQGRRHFYEGEGWEPVVAPVRIAKSLGVKTLLLTNAAGGINETFAPGNLMVVTDHINLMAGNPLIGPHDPFLGPRFPDQTLVYDSSLREKLLAAGEEADSPPQQGVYLALSGPAFETPAEIRAFGKLGADAVGMSTVPEAMAANAAGLRVAALSCISNLAAGISSQPLSHEEVNETAQLAMPRMRQLVAAYFEKICEKD
jgi:purine-nucleoside phosphorylase